MKKHRSFYFIRKFYNQLWDEKNYHKYKTTKLEKLEEYLVFLKNILVKSLGNKILKRRIKYKISKTKRQIKRSQISIRFIYSKIRWEFEKTNITFG